MATVFNYSWATFCLCAKQFNELIAYCRDIIASIEVLFFCLCRFFFFVRNYQLNEYQLPPLIANQISFKSIWIVKWKLLTFIINSFVIEINILMQYTNYGALEHTIKFVCAAKLYLNYHLSNIINENLLWVSPDSLSENHVG